MYPKVPWAKLFLPIVFLASCATYFEKSHEFQKAFVRGDLVRASRTLDQNKKAAKGKDRLLYFLQKGIVLQMQGKYEESNIFFEEAYLFGEDFRKNYGQRVSGLLLNPEVEPYIGEDFEIVLIHYYKALNFLFQYRYEEALVECRRMDNKLKLLNDKYPNKKNRYNRDAFIHNLMGIIYEASGDVNNSFIAYRNALEVYQEDYRLFFGTGVPEQLKQDVLRTAYLNGFGEELEKYETQFNQKYQYDPDPDGSLIFFWHNGLGPVKSEWSLNFFLIRGTAAMITFVNEEYALSFPFPVSSKEENEGLGNLKIVRAAFPKYLERKPYYRSANLISEERIITLELAENINDIAFKTLEDRMIREFSTSLLRLAVKQASEAALREKNQDLGALLSVMNALSEKTDTRNWQTLPHSIHYARIPLKQGNNIFRFTATSPQGNRNFSKDFHFQGMKGKVQFFMFHNLETVGLTF